MKGKITVLWLGKTAWGNGGLCAHCLIGMSGCPGASEQDRPFPGVVIGQGAPFQL